MHPVSSSIPQKASALLSGIGGEPHAYEQLLLLKLLLLAEN